jgi:malonyl CoA-acyl carrier protein transacylase
MATSWTGVIAGNQEQVDKATAILRETVEKAQAGTFYVGDHTYSGLLSTILDAMDVEWKVEW